MDGPEHIREKALRAIDATKFVPDQGRNRIGSMVAARPDWCISRQRAWGCRSRSSWKNAPANRCAIRAVVDRIVAVFTAEGADAWYASPPSRSWATITIPTTMSRSTTSSSLVRVRIDPCLRAGGQASALASRFVS